MNVPPGLTAITFNDDGGGVGAVARLVRRVFTEVWGPEVPTFELVRSSAPRPWLPRTAGRIRFGLRLAAAEAGGRVSWVFHTHIATARVQRLLPARASRPYAVFLHGIEAWEQLGPSDRALLDEAALVVTNSIHTARRAAAVNPNLPPISVCPLGFSSSDRPRLEPEPNQRPTVLTVARMAASERYKGHDQLIEALPAILKRVPDARLMFVGTGDDVDRLKRKAAEHGLADRVVFTGYLPQDALDRAYANATVFAMPSLGEGFGLAYLEAMAAGLPCVGTVHDAASEIIVDGVTGYLVEQHDLDGIADRIATLLQNSEQRHAMGQSGRERWAREFTYAHFRQRLVTALDDAFRVRRGRAATVSSAVG